MTNKNIKQILNKLEDHEKRIRTLEMGTRLSQTQIVKKKVETSSSHNLILSIVNKIGECEESKVIQSKILDQKSMEGKILLCLYISYKYFKNAWLTTGDIAKITSELGIKIDVRNITNKMKKLRRYLESGATRKKGQPTPYRLNHKGVKRFEEIVHPQEK